MISLASMSEVGSQIRTLRESLGFGLDAVARKANLLPERAQEIESGGPLTTQELAALAAALGTDAPTLLRGRLSDPRRSVARFRSAHGVSFASNEAALGAADLRLLSMAAELGRVGAYLNDLLDRPASPVGQQRAPRAVRGYPDAWKQGYDLGTAARTTFAATREP